MTRDLVVFASVALFRAVPPSGDEWTAFHVIGMGSCPDVCDTQWSADPCEAETEAAVIEGCRTGGTMSSDAVCNWIFCGRDGRSVYENTPSSNTFDRDGGLARVAIDEPTPSETEGTDGGVDGAYVAVAVGV